jgi:hypothetical protein
MKVVLGVDLGLGLTVDDWRWTWYGVAEEWRDLCGMIPTLVFVSADVDVSLFQRETKRFNYFNCSLRNSCNTASGPSSAQSRRILGLAFVVQRSSLAAGCTDACS